MIHLCTLHTKSNSHVICYETEGVNTDIASIRRRLNTSHLWRDEPTGGIIVFYTSELDVG